MAQFDMYTSFMFDGISSDSYSLKIYSLQNSFNKYYGLNRDVNMTESGYRKIYKGVKNKNITIPLIIAKTDMLDIPLSITRDEEIEITRWLFKRSPKALTFDGTNKNYYGVFSANDDSWFNSNNHGYISLDFILTGDGTAYDSINTTYKYLNNESTIITLENMCDINEQVFLDIHITCYSENGVISIKNLLTGQEVVLNGLTINNSYSIYGERRFVINNTNSKEDAYSKVIKPTWIELLYGLNDIEIKALKGEFEMVLEFQPQLSL